MSSSAAARVVIGALVVLGCDPGVDPRRAELREAGVTPGSKPGRGRLLAGERVARIPRWPAASTIDRAALARLPAMARAAVEISPVPVLVPGDTSWLANVAVVTERGLDGGPGWGYALSARRGEVTMAVQASRIATMLAGVGHVRGNRRLRGVDGFLSANDGIRTASWIEHGIAYSLDLECRDPDGPECAEQALREAVEGLVYVGGIGGGA